MTGDERLAKVAEVLAGHVAHYHAGSGHAVCDSDCDWEFWGNLPDFMKAIQRHQADMLKPLLDEFRAEGEARALRAIRAVLDESCHHCGSGPDDDGDHSCPCPNTDSECLTHLEYPVQPTNLRAALAAAEPDAGER